MIKKFKQKRTQYVTLSVVEEVKEIQNVCGITIETKYFCPNCGQELTDILLYPEEFPFCLTYCPTCGTYLIDEDYEEDYEDDYEEDGY